MRSMRETALALGAMALAAGVWAAASAQSGGPIVRAEFTAANEAIRPEGYRHWVFIGSPLTPHALNGGAAPFPEFHNVYIEPSAYAHFEATGTFAEGTQIVKELVLIRQNDNDPETGASAEVSGISYQQGEFAGLELKVKDSARFPDMPGGWAYFSFGHQPEPYAETAAAFPVDTCNACHAANAETDWVFTQFYPVLRAVQK